MVDEERGAPYRLHIAVDRGRGPVYVLLHGINSTGHDWDTVVTAMGFDRRCIAVDELGYGRSPKPLDIDYTIDDHVDALHFTLHDHGIDEPLVIVGYSMGGPIALRYAVRYPEEISRLILISAPFFLRPEQIGEKAYAKAVFQTEGSQAVLNMVASAGFARSKIFEVLSADDRQVIQSFINAQDLQTDWRILQKNMTNVIQGSDFPADLVRVKAPITFMIGEKDAFIVRSQIETLRDEWAPNMEIRFLADLKADHMLLENVPGLIADEIVKWEDRRLAVALDRGEGEIFVLLHGIENDGSFWNAVGAAIATQHRAVALDLLGFGQSPKPLDIAYSIDDQVTSIEETIQSLLETDAVFTLVGHSLGSLIAAGYARRHPERVKRLVLFSPPIKSCCELDDDKLGHRARATLVENFGELRRRGRKLTRGGMRGVLGFERLARYEPSLRSLQNIIEQETLADDLAEVPLLPVTIVHGRRDPFVVPEYVRKLAEQRAGTEVVELDAAHDIATELPLEALSAIAPDIDRTLAADVVRKANTDRKLRPAVRGLTNAFDADSLIVGARGILYVAFGVGIAVLPSGGDLRLLRIAFALFLFGRSISTLTGLITTTSIRQERLTSILSGVSGIVVGIFLMVSLNLARSVLFFVVGSYLLVNGLIQLYGGLRAPHSSRRRWRLLIEGGASVAAGILLLAGSVVVARIVLALLAVASVAAGVSMLGYAALLRRTGTGVGPRASRT